MQALFDAIAQLPRPAEAQRFFHGRGGLHPGCEAWSLDAYPPVWVLTCFDEVADALLAQLHEALVTRWTQVAPGESLNWVFQSRHEGQARTRLMAGQVPEPHVVQEAGTQYLVHVLRGQNHGLFLDMAGGRTWVAQWVQQWVRGRSPGGAGAPGRGPRVLNLFAYTCAFSVVALKAGASHVVNLDMAKGALAIGQRNHALNGLHGLAQGSSFLPHDLFSSWGKVTRLGPYDLVVMDPPSYQKGSFVATKDYVRMLRRLPDLLAPGGHALLCLNAPELGLDFLAQQVAEQVPQLQLVERVANPPAFADVSSDRALKVLVYRWPEG
jgi:23S rRNA (cytosine1962-C5)-methyltransferase